MEQNIIELCDNCVNVLGNADWLGLAAIKLRYLKGELTENVCELCKKDEPKHRICYRHMYRDTF